MTSICVFGAGAIGGLVAGHLAHAGATPTVVARGTALEALKAGPVSITDGESRFTVRLNAIENTATESIGPQDLLFLAVKAHQLIPALPDIKPLMSESTIVVPLLNGIPWWYCKGLPAPLENRNLRSIDPTGRISALIPVRQVVGCSVYISGSNPNPGTYRNVGPRTLVIGTPTEQSGSESLVASTLTRAGFRVKVSRRIRREIWDKLWGNAFVNPVSLLTEAPMDQLFSDKGISDLGRRMVREVIAVANRCGEHPSTDLDDRWQKWGRITRFKTSMLQDLEKSRAVEIDAILGAVCELGRITATPTPTLDRIYALAKSKATRLACYVPPA